MSVKVDNLELWLPRLAWLDAWLARYDLPRGPDRWQKAQDLLLVHDLQGRFPDPWGMQLVLAPLFCRSDEEQQRFGEAFEHWLKEYEEPGEAEKCGSTTTTEHLPPDPPPPPKGRLAILLVLLVCLGLLFGVGYWSSYDPQPPKRADDNPVSSGSWGDERLPPVADPELIPVLPRLQAEPLERLFPPSPRFTAFVDAVPWLLGALPLLLGLGWLLWRWLRWRPLLRNRLGSGDDPIANITFDPEEDGLFNDAALRGALRRLHTPVPSPTRRVDAAATVDATARHAGLLQPRYIDRFSVPECVVLADSRHSEDHLGALAALFAQRLREADLEVQLYHFDRYPGRVRPADGGPGETLFDLAARHAGARLLLIGEPTLLVDPYREAVHSWVEDQHEWGERVLLSTRRAPAAWLPLLETEGIRVGDFTADGLIRLTEAMTGAPRPAGVPAPFRLLPPVLLEEGSWNALFPPEPELGKRVMAALSRFLGRDGMQLLAAMAAYPVLHWELTRALDLSLLDQGGAARREARLFAIARLPWSRQGWLPEWLRQALRDSRSEAQREAIDGFYRNLMLQAEVDGSGRVALPVATGGERRPALLRWLRDWWQTRGARALPRDRIFASVLLGRRVRPLDLPLARHLLEKLPIAPRLLLPRLVGVVLTAGVVGWGLVAGWEAWARESVERWLSEVEQPDFSGQSVTIHHTAATEPLAWVLQGTLEGFGFPSPQLEVVPMADEFDNRLILGEGASAEAASFVAQRLRYLTWGLPVVNAAGGGQGAGEGVVVELYTTGRTGSQFRDDLAVTLTPERLAELGRPWEERLVDRRERLVSFRDALQGGGQGPEMVVLPPGEFLMGSPEDEPQRYPDEGPQHPVTIGSFALSKSEVTFDDYDRFARATGRELPWDGGLGRGLRPVINVSWEDATAYAQWLSERSGHAYRLPSEAEWEYAARAGTTTPFSTGDCITTDQANYDGTEDYNDCSAKTGDYRRQTLPAGSLPANPWGLHELHGNVFEWVQDCWHENYRDAPRDGTPWLEPDGGDCIRRVIRGGAWNIYPRGLRSASRNRGSARAAWDFLGFRVARAY